MYSPKSRAVARRSDGLCRSGTRDGSRLCRTRDNNCNIFASPGRARAEGKLFAVRPVFACTVRRKFALNTAVRVCVQCLLVNLTDRRALRTECCGRTTTIQRDIASYNNIMSWCIMCAWVYLGATRVCRRRVCRGGVEKGTGRPATDQWRARSRYARSRRPPTAGPPA